MADLDFSDFRALVVEDNDFVRLMVTRYLTEFGFAEVFEATNAAEGKEQLERQPDIVICDINMAPSDGYELLNHIRSSGGPQAKLPFIFLTGNADKSFVQKAIDMKVDAYLLKPVQPQQLKKKIVTLMMQRLTA
jgi:two-component system, chemotaxis family, chemotaxis protein CheY